MPAIRAIKLKPTARLGHAVVVLAVLIGLSVLGYITGFGWSGLGGIAVIVGSLIRRRFRDRARGQPGTLNR
jgi:hypothetical protein